MDRQHDTPSGDHFLIVLDSMDVIPCEHLGCNVLAGLDNPRNCVGSWEHWPKE
jgi:hypothetical protein